MPTRDSLGTPFADSRIVAYERCLLDVYIMGAGIGAGVAKVIFQTIKDLKTRGVEAGLGFHDVKPRKVKPRSGLTRARDWRGARPKGAARSRCLA
jgi:hypothetical protein